MSPPEREALNSKSVALGPVVARAPPVEYMHFDTGVGRFRFHEIDIAARTVAIDATTCMQCHSGRPNWDSYDSWGGMLSFNRDRIYKGSLEAAALRNTLNLWDKSGHYRAIIEQLNLPAGSDEGRGVDLFDNLTPLNAKRIAQDLIEHPRTPVDVRPIALAVARGCDLTPALNAHSAILQRGGNLPGRFSVLVRASAGSPGARHCRSSTERPAHRTRPEWH